MMKAAVKKQTIHPTAIVSREASLGEGVEIGPYSIVGPEVRIGRGTKISSHVRIEGDTQIGERCAIFPGAVLGMPAQVRKAAKVRSGVVIGNDNVFREYVTVHAGMNEGSKTVLGDRNFLMANAHVGHDCLLGNDITIANSTALGGHVQIDDGALLGGVAGVHQFVRIGKLTMLGAVSKAVMDLAPFSIYEGQRAKFCGVNVVGLKRAGFSSQRILEVKKALVALLDGRNNFSNVIPVIKTRFKGNADVQAILAFIRESKRGVGRAED